MNYILLIIAFTSAGISASAQKKVVNFVDIAGTAGASQGTVAASFIHNWKVGKNKRWEAGLGLRNTTYFGVKNQFITAPAKLARTNTIPFLIVFAGQKEENFDTLTVQRPLINALNITANLGYQYKQWYAGVNIDLIGFSIGRNSSAILLSNGQTKTESKAVPAHFNALLTGDHDYGTLNSEFFVRYSLNSRWGIRAIYQFLFAEYKTTTISQTAPDGTVVTRFRNKANNLGAGISYHFK